MLKDWLYWKIFRRLLRWNLFLRVGIRRSLFRKSSAVTASKAIGLDRVSIFYINLDHRLDRKKQIEAEFKRLGVSSSVRVPGVRVAHGGMGNALSHVICLNSGWDPKKELLMICEDDAQFLVGRATLDDLIEEFVSNDFLDVLCLAYASLEKPVGISPTMAVANHIQTTSCYIMKRHAVPVLRRSAARAVQKLSNGIPFARASFDRVWKVEQQRLIFALPIDRAVQQRPSYSDVEGRDVAYRA